MDSAVFRNGINGKRVFVMVVYAMRFKFLAGVFGALLVAGGFVSGALRGDEGFTVPAKAAPERFREESDAGTGGAGAAQGREPVHLDVGTVVRRVRGQNPQVLFEREGVRRALQRSFRQRAELLPQISLRANQERRQFAQGFTGQSADIPPLNNFSTRLEGTLTAADTEQYADYRIAVLDKAVARMNYEVVLQDVLEQAMMLYYTHLRDLRDREILRGEIERDRELLELAENRYDAGRAVKIDVTRAEVQVARSRRELVDARIAGQDSLSQLKALLDLDPERPVTVDRSILEDVREPESLVDVAAGKALAGMRPELRKGRRELEQARLNRRAAAWQRLPVVELFANWGYDSDEIFDGQENEAWVVGVRAEMPIFEGFRIRAEKREADAEIRQNEYSLKELRNRIRRELSFTHSEMSSRFTQIGLAREEVRLGREEIEQARRRYREGSADNRELIEAQQSLSEAQSSHVRALFLYGMSRVSFARAIGSVERVLE